MVLRDEELISELRDQAEVIGPGTECHLLNEAADRIEDESERIDIMAAEMGDMERAIRRLFTIVCLLGIGLAVLLAIVVLFLV